MAVLIEAVSVVVKVAALDQQFSGGWEAFSALIPNRTSCVDGQLIRLGFMTPAEAESFVNDLRRYGLTYLRDGQAIDLVIVDQLRGPTTPCDWIEFGTVTIRGSNVAACRLTGDETRQLFTPDGWQFEGSLSQTAAYGPSATNEAAKAEATQADDASEMLAMGAEAWLKDLSGEGVIPRAFFGITDHDQKFLLPLNTGLINQQNRVQFLRWLCQRVVAYAYVTHVRRFRDSDDPESAEEGVDIYASSMTRDVTIRLAIERHTDGSLTCRRNHYSSQAASDDPGQFAGLQRTKAEVDAQEAAQFDEIWQEIAPTVQWMKE